MFDFPSTPALDEIYQSWKWNGEAWKTFASATATPPTDALTITALDPPSLPIGELRQTVMVRGTRFSSASVVNWAGDDIPTTFVDAATLEVTIYPTAVLTPRSFPVYVKDGTDVSNTVDFTFTDALAVLTSINPNTGVCGTPAVPAKAYGTNFNVATQIRVEGGSIPNTTFVSSTELDWFILTQTESVPRTAQVTLNFGSGSVPVTFTATAARGAPRAFKPPPRRR